MKHIFHTLLIILLSITSCTSKQEIILEKGVSSKLAKHRKETIKNVEYDLFFDIPALKNEKVVGELSILFDVEKQEDIILDFKADQAKSLIHQVRVNGDSSNVIIENEHIIIPSKDVDVGRNKVVIHFDAPNTSLNRRDDMLYTLLVPDRARTLFPCFEQPNIKAKFSLKLAIPDHWEAISNGSVIKNEGKEGTKSRLLEFNQTKPISTYLFSFAVGKFSVRDYKQGDHQIKIYYRSEKEQELQQLQQIAEEVFFSLNWLEEYTQIKYPFEKYDLVIVPGFQYGGMEHMGATLYNAGKMFLSKDASITQTISRSSLIAHETAHMWFGDLVTMDWFDDVWNKEVFANYYADEIIRELYPEIDNRINFTKYFKASYDEDRTLGTNALSQKLDNLQDAGLVYGSIIYNKAPIMMQMLVEKIGKEVYDNGIREYLRTYSYDNAKWDDLIAILDKHTDHNLTEWSKVWVGEKGMPTIEMIIKDDSLFITQSDPLERGITWSQKISLLAIGDNFTTPISVELSELETSKKLPKGTKYIIPNHDMKAYGFFDLDSLSLNYAMDSISTFKDAIIKVSMLSNLHENALNRNIRAEAYTEALMRYIPSETDQILFLNAIDKLYYCSKYMSLDSNLQARLENFFWEMVTADDKTYRNTESLTKLISIAKSKRTRTNLLKVYKGEHQVKIEDIDKRINLCYELAVWFPDSYQDLISSQLAEIKNPDKRDEFMYISKAVSSSETERDSVFNSLLDAKNRHIEPWTRKSLALLNHSDRADRAVKYILPGLEVLTEIHFTGDIFFPKAWASSLLQNHTSTEAFKIVNEYIKQNEGELEPMLMNKIKQASYWIYRLEYN